MLSLKQALEISTGIRSLFVNGDPSQKEDLRAIMKGGRFHKPPAVH
jgi:hypothetical protein